MISELELSSIRHDAEGLLPGTCVIQALSEVPNGRGGQTESYVDGAATPCRLAPLGGDGSGTPGDRIDERTAHVFTLPADADVELGSRLVCEGRTWAVTVLRERTGADTLVKRAEVEEVL